MLPSKRSVTGACDRFLTNKIPCTRMLGYSCLPITPYIIIWQQHGRSGHVPTGKPSAPSYQNTPGVADPKPQARALRLTACYKPIAALP
ncbi:Uncharacterised protein [Bordetella pertussis]|nr:Uncharacterised protein [Bordetella pertussis]